MSYTIDRYKGGADRAPIQTFLSMCAEIDRLRHDVQSAQARADVWHDRSDQQTQTLEDLMRDNTNLIGFNQRLMAELAQHGWGDFHFTGQPQSPAIVALLKEGRYGDYAGTDASPAGGSGESGEREDPVGRSGSREDQDSASVLPEEGGTT
jgi:hypothetical protein